SQEDNLFSFEVLPFRSKPSNDNEASNEPTGSKEIDTAENEEDDIFAINETHQTTIKNNNQKSTALYYQAHIKNKEISLIVDSGSSGCIISAALMEELGMESSSNQMKVKIFYCNRRTAL
ncbi:161_t:CDS:2, partial [Funneliformis geosporum]